MTDYLFATPSIIAGIASCIDMFGVYNSYNDSENEIIADKKAMLSDVLTLKKDFIMSYNKVINEQT